MARSRGPLSYRRWMSQEPIESFPLGVHNGRVSHVLTRIAEGAVLAWLIDDDIEEGTETVLLVHLTDDEAEAVVESLEKPLVGMLEPIRSTMVDRGALALRLDKSDTVVARTPIKIPRTGTEEDFIKLVFAMMRNPLSRMNARVRSKPRRSPRVARDALGQVVGHAV